MRLKIGTFELELQTSLILLGIIIFIVYQVFKHYNPTMSVFGG